MSDEDPNVERAERAAERADASAPAEGADASAPADAPATAAAPAPAPAPAPAVFGGMTPEQAMQMLSVETNKRRRVSTSYQSGSRLVSIGLVTGVLALGAAMLLPPSLERLSWLLGALAVLSGGFGLLRLFAAWQLGRR
ncbi:MAG: hypothetical protein U0353_07730 [Sandaracinus sp.]